MEQLKVTFAQAEIPVFTPQYANQNRYISFGNENRYPDYLIDLYNGAAKHAAIINGKCTYIAGSGFVTTDEPTKQFLAKANEKQTWDELIKELCKDVELFGGFYLQCIKKNNGSGFNFYKVSYDRVRTNEENTKFWYRKDWKVWTGEQIFEAFTPNTEKRSTIFFYKETYAKKQPYAFPSYLSALNLIAAEKAVGEAILTNAKSGFTATKMITFIGQEPAPEKKREIVNRLEARYSGESGNRLVVQWVNDVNLATKVEDLGTTDLTKEDYTAIDNLITSAEFAGHGVTHPLLFGIQQEGKLGGASELKEAYYIFKNTYSNAKQKNLEQVVKYFAEINGVANPDIKLKDVEPIDLEINPIDFKEILPKEWVLEKLGIDLTKYGIEPTQQPGVAPIQQGNDVLINLTGRQQQQLLRIVSKFSKGQMTKAMAAIQLQAYGFSDEQINKYLGVDDDPSTEDMQFADDSEAVMLAMFESEEFGESPENYNIISQQNFTDQDEFQFAFKSVNELNEIEQKVAGLIKEKQDITNEQIAENLNIPLATVVTILEELAIAGIVTTAANAAGKLIRKVPDGVVKVKLPEIKVMYSYEKRAGVDGPTLLPTSRPFCQKMVALSATKLFSRQDIQKISERLGYSVFKRAGGFWNNNGKIEFQCRHGWIQKVVTKKR
jgi:hypothetical protein